MICIAPSAIVCSPDEQNRLIVCAGTSTGSPARSAESRATLSPCDASGIAQPHATSSTIAALDAGAVERLLHHERGQLDGMRRGERSILLALGHRGADGRNDHDVVGLSGLGLSVTIHL